MSLDPSEPAQGPTRLQSIHVHSTHNIKIIICQGSAALVALYISNLCRCHDPTSQSAAPNPRSSAVIALAALVTYTQHPTMCMRIAFDLRMVASHHTYRSTKRSIISGQLSLQGLPGLLEH